MLARYAGLVCLLAVLAHDAPAQLGNTADAILIHGKVARFDGAPAEALAVQGGRIAAIGRTADIRALAGPGTRIIELAGRTVIPGLIDSHIHAIRAGLTWQSEVHWIGVASLADALDRLRAAAKTVPKGSWLVVAGGWVERQFVEGRRPTQAEIAAAAPDHHVYVQVLYSAVLLSPGGFDALGVRNDRDLASRLKIETGPDGRSTGWLSGDNRSISDLFDRLPRPTFSQQVAGTRAFFRTLNSFGVTGVIDPGGYNLPVDAYRALFQVWRDRALTIRVVYSLCAPRRGHELGDFQALTAMLPMGSGDDWLRFNGIGENVTWDMYNNDAPTDAQKEHLLRVLRWAAPRGLGATFHWHNDRSVHHLIDVLERVNLEMPIAPLRWSIAHLNDASRDSLRRMKTLGVGWLVQNAFYFRGEAFLGQRGADAARLAPPIASALRMAVPVGGGTDAHRVMSHNPFVALQWMLDGKTVGGTPMRAAEETPARMEALRIFTQGSAWFAHDDGRRGALEVGKLADLAVLSKDYFSVAPDEVGSIRALLTMVDGRIVYADGPYAQIEDQPLPVKQ
ncbi:MAG: amidohydrolase [Burkholderiales bacterium]